MCRYRENFSWSVFYVVTVILIMLVPNLGYGALYAFKSTYVDSFGKYANYELHSGATENDAIRKASSAMPGEIEIIQKCDCGWAAQITGTTVLSSGKHSEGAWACGYPTKEEAVDAASKNALKSGRIREGGSVYYWYDNGQGYEWNDGDKHIITIASGIVSFEGPDLTSPKWRVESSWDDYIKKFPSGDSACAGEPSSGTDKAVTIENGSGSGMVTIFRPSGFGGSSISNQLSVDGKAAGTIGNGESVTADLSEGTHTLANVRIYKGAWQGECNSQIEVREGETYKFELTMKRLAGTTASSPLETACSFDAR